jgi:hypothetical protein
MSAGLQASNSPAVESLGWIACMIRCLQAAQLSDLHTDVRSG